MRSDQPASSRQSDTTDLELEVVGDLATVDAEHWNALAGDDDPFIEHGFLAGLERAGCVGPEAGWVPCHVLARHRPTGRLLGAVPLYLKDNSYGEYIFDWGWAEASHSAGVPYYPKLVSAVPFTPVTGRRLLTADGATSGPVVDALVAGVRRVADETDASSIHWLFVTPDEQRALAEQHDFAPRLTHQYHWHNDGYRNFDDYLTHFRAPARKNVRRERRRAQETGLTLRTTFGPDLSTRDWRALWRFYCDTTSRKWGQPYLNRRFFDDLRANHADRIVCTFADDDSDRPVAGTLNLYKGAHLYGRYWGCLQEHDALHFELCYYQLIELAISREMRRFEAGAQGSHKIKRGLMPALTHSSHWLRHPGLDAAVSRFLAREAAMLQHELNAMTRVGPFKRDSDCRGKR